MKLQLRHLNYFVAVAEELNFHKASARLFVSQPTLSHQIAQLEDILGVSLLERDKRHVDLTEAGKLLYEKSLHILETVDTSIAQVKDMATKKPLIVGVPNYHSFDIISETLHEFAVGNPSISLDIREMQAVEMNEALQRRKIDLGFLALPFPPSENENLKFKVIAKEPYLVCISKSHPYFEQPAMNAEALKDSKFFLLPHNVHPTFHDFVISKFREMGFEPKLGGEAVSTQAQYGLVAAEMGVCLALKTSPIPPNNLEVRPLDPPLLHHELTIAYHQDNNRSELIKFANPFSELGNE